MRKTERNFISLEIFIYVLILLLEKKLENQSRVLHQKGKLKYIYQTYVQNLIIKITSTAMILLFKNYMNYGFKDIKILSNLVHFMLLKTY